MKHIQCQEHPTHKCVAMTALENKTMKKSMSNRTFKISFHYKLISQGHYTVDKHEETT